MYSSVLWPLECSAADVRLRILGDNGRKRSLTNIDYSLGPFQFSGATRVAGRDFIQLRFEFLESTYHPDKNDRGIGLLHKGNPRVNGLGKRMVIPTKDTPNASWTKTKILDIAASVVVITSAEPWQPRDPFMLGGFHAREAKPPELSLDVSPEKVTAGNLSKILARAMNKYASIMETSEEWKKWKPKEDVVPLKLYTPEKKKDRASSKTWALPWRDIFLDP